VPETGPIISRREVHPSRPWAGLVVIRPQQATDIIAHVMTRDVRGLHDNVAHRVRRVKRAARALDPSIHPYTRLSPLTAAGLCSLCSPLFNQCLRSSLRPPLVLSYRNNSTITTTTTITTNIRKHNLPPQVHVRELHLHATVQLPNHNFQFPAMIGPSALLLNL
jgi:hypothetical protein